MRLINDENLIFDELTVECQEWRNNASDRKMKIWLGVIADDDYAYGTITKAEAIQLRDRLNDLIERK